MTIGAWALFLASLAGMWALNQSQRLGKAKLVVAIVRAFLAFTAGVAMARIVLGDWLSRLLTIITGWVGGWFDMSSSVTLGLLTLLLVAIAIFGLMDRRADKPELIALILLPTLFIATGAGVAGPGSELANSWFEFGSSGLASILGG